MLGKIAAYIRAMELYYQMAHNVVKGALFISDHGLLGEFYTQLGGNYDAVAERAVNIEGDAAVDILPQLKDIFQHLKVKPGINVKENKEYFIAGLECEKMLCQMIDQVCKDPSTSEGTRQLIGDIADQSEIRQYKINRRIK